MFIIFLFYEYLEIINNTTLLKIKQIGIVVIMKHPVPPMIIVNHNTYHIIKLHLITNVNSIVMIELHKKFLPIMCIIGKNWISKVSFIVEYQLA